jgi:hypothetical protein
MVVDDEMVVLGQNRRDPFIGRGRLSEGQVGRAVERLRGVAPNVIKIVVTHHPFDLPDHYGADHLVGRAQMAMAQLATVGADLFLAGHLHVSHIGHTAERYKIAGHSALVVQAGTISTRERGEPNSFNVLRVDWPRVAVVRQTWDDAREIFVESSARTFRHQPQGWLADSFANASTFHHGPFSAGPAHTLAQIPETNRAFGDGAARRRRAPALA